MTDRDTNTKKLKVLADTLDRYGSDIVRWPDDLRKDLAPMIESDARAKTVIAEAVALDTILETVAPGVDTERETKLAARIMASLDHELGSKTVAGSNAVPLGSNHEPRAEVVAFRPRPRVSPEQWQTAGLLAASLVIGVFSGNAGLFDSTVNSFPTTTIASEPSSSLTLSALVEDDADDLGDEELL